MQGYLIGQAVDVKNELGDTNRSEKIKTKIGLLLAKPEMRRLGAHARIGVGISEIRLAREDLIKKAMHGNRGALETLCKDIAKSVLFSAKCLLSGSSEAEDVAQEVLIRVCKRIHMLNNAQAFDAWLNTIVLHEVRRHQKKVQASTRTLYVEEYPSEPIEEDRELLPLDYVLMKEDCEAVMGIVATLPERQKEAVMLHYYQGFNITKTAEIMSIARPSASIYLKLAREKIKEELLCQEKLTERHFDERDARRTAEQAVVKLAQVHVEKPELSKVGAGASLGALAALPIGSLLTETFTAEAARLETAARPWIAGAVTHAISAANVLGALKPIVTAATTLVVATALVGTLVASTILSSNESGALDIETGYQVVFDGGISTTYEHLNPQTAAVDDTNSENTLAVQSWVITEEGSSNTLYSGQGSVAEEPFALLPDGIYTITFTLEDEFGKTYARYGIFQVLEGAPTTPILSLPLTVPLLSQPSTISVNNSSVSCVK